MKCWFGHSPMKGFSSERTIVKVSSYFGFGLRCVTQYSRRDHVCEKCKTHYSEIRQLDPHTIEMLEPEQKVRIGDVLPQRKRGKNEK